MLAHLPFSDDFAHQLPTRLRFPTSAQGAA